MQIHETAVIDNGAKIGEGTKIWHFSHVMAGSKIGKNVSIGQNCFIGENVEIGNNVKIQNNVSLYDGVIIKDNVFIGPSAVFTNVIKPRSEYPTNKKYSGTLINNGVSIGANATIICGTVLGEYCFVGSGAVVTKDIPSNALVVGNPSKIIGWVGESGEKLEINGNKGLDKILNIEYEVFITENKIVNVKKIDNH